MQQQKAYKGWRGSFLRGQEAAQARCKALAFCQPQVYDALHVDRLDTHEPRNCGCPRSHEACTRAA